MTHIITQPCCNDATCVAVCPVDCIHPTPDEPGYALSQMLYINPAACIDCGACVEVCPVDAIVPDTELNVLTEPFAELNAAYYDQQLPEPAAPEPLVEVGEQTGPLRVAIVGSGPAACYAAEELLARPGLSVEVSIFERLPVPWGLVRYGVAPDHQHTKAVTKLFQTVAGRRGVTFYLNVEVGKDLSHAELLEHHHAVIYAVGASGDRRLGIPGEDLPGSHSATDFVGWYNGHPDFAGKVFDFSAERAVVIGNGNVALDIARLLVCDVADLAATDIAGHALEALAESRVNEVVVVGRRGPEQAAFSTPELIGLGQMPGIDVVPVQDEPGPAGTAPALGPMEALKQRILTGYAGRGTTPGNRRIRLAFRRSPMQMLGADRVEGIRMGLNRPVGGPGAVGTFEASGDWEDLDCGLVIRSVGFRGQAPAGIPFDEVRGLIPNSRGRIVAPESGAAEAGAYVAGWIKRGPSGVIGSNKTCAAETVHSLLEDLAAGLLPAPGAAKPELDGLVAARALHLGFPGWKKIDAHERRTGKETGQPRRKLVAVEEMLRIAGR